MTWRVEGRGWSGEGERCEGKWKSKIMIPHGMVTHGVPPLTHLHASFSSPSFSLMLLAAQPLLNGDPLFLTYKQSKKSSGNVTGWWAAEQITTSYDISNDNEG